MLQAESVSDFMCRQTQHHLAITGILHIKIRAFCDFIKQILAYFVFVAIGADQVLIHLPHFMTSQLWKETPQDWDE